MIPVDSREFFVHHHGNQAFVVMNDLRLKQQLCDITLCIDNQEFHAHKIVLAGCSPYLRAMFTNGMLESGKSLVTIRDIEPQTMESLLNYIYTGLIEVTTSNVQSLLQAASLLTLTDLRNICSQFLKLHLQASNCLGIYSLADMYSCTDLIEATRDFISHHFLEIVQHEEFINLTETQIIDLLEHDTLQVISEEQVFEAAMLWINSLPEQRRRSACQIMHRLKLALLDTCYLEEVVLRRDFIRNCAQCQDLVADAMRTRTIDRPRIDTIQMRGDMCGIYVLGGRNSEDCQLRTVEKFDVLKSRWMKMPQMKVARTAVGASVVDGVVYAIGGECALEQPQDDETHYLSSVEAFDTLRKEWHVCAEMRHARSFVAACTLGGYIYAIGGEDKDGSFSAVERYDPHADSWSRVTPMIRKRAGCGVTVCEGKIYVAGGSDKVLHTDRASIECFDPLTQKWTFVAEMEKGRSGLVIVSLDHYLYVIGGRSRCLDQYYDWVERYDLWTKEWTDLCPLNIPRAWPCAVVVDNKIYVIGGYNGTSRLRSAEFYDLDTDTWTFITNMTACRAGCAAVWVS